MRKMKSDNKGVSVVIGTVLMLTITVSIMVPISLAFGSFAENVGGLLDSESESNDRLTEYMNDVLNDKTNVTNPVTTLTLEGDTADGITFTDNVLATLEATDLSGISCICYTYGTLDWQVYDTAFTIDVVGQYGFLYFSTDNFGNTEVPQYRYFEII